MSALASLLNCVSLANESRAEKALLVPAPFLLFIEFLPPLVDDELLFLPVAIFLVFLIKLLAPLADVSSKSLIVNFISYVSSFMHTASLKRHVIMPHNNCRAQNEKIQGNCASFIQIIKIWKI